MQGLFGQLESALGMDLNNDGNAGQNAAPPQAGQQQPYAANLSTFPPTNLSTFPPQAPPHAPDAAALAVQNTVAPPPPPVPQPSQGNYKALFVGINYFGQEGELHGCVNDVQNMTCCLQRLNYPLGNVKVLVDDPKYPGRAGDPTKASIEREIAWLVGGARPGDNLFFHYSGHGAKVQDVDRDESDHYDETLVPVDYRSAGMILDDDLFKMLVAPLPAGVRLTAILDCCHSGTVLDLPYLWVASDENLRNPSPLMFLSQFFTLPKQLQTVINVIDKVSKTNFKQIPFGIGDKLDNLSHHLGVLAGPVGAATGHPQQGAAAQGQGQGQGQFQTSSQKQVLADIILLSGCADSQTSADVPTTGQFQLPPTNGPGGAGGACSCSFIEALAKTPNCTFLQLLSTMRENLRARGFSQVPQLSSSKPVDLTSPFSVFGPIHVASKFMEPPANANYVQPDTATTNIAQFVQGHFPQYLKQLAI